MERQSGEGASCDKGSVPVGFMFFQLPCYCGKEVRVEGSQAGQVVKCSCGRPLTVPSSRSLKKMAATGSPDLKSLGLASAETTPSEETFEEHSLVLTSGKWLRKRIDSDACSRFVAQVHKQVHAFAAEAVGGSEIFFQIGYAILPRRSSRHGHLLIDIQSSPIGLDEEQAKQLKERLKRLRIPQVVGGPVAFVARIRTGESSKATVAPPFLPPFLPYFQSRGPQSLDGIVMRGAGLDWSEKRRWLPRAVRLKWQRWGQWWIEMKRLVYERTWLRWRNWAHGIQTLPDRVQKNIENSSLALLSHWLEVYPQSDVLLKARAAQWFSQREWQSAIADYTEYLKLRPQDADAYSRRGEAHCHLDQVQLGLGDFKSALECKPNSIEALVGLSTIYLDLSAWDQADKELTRAIEQSPRMARLYLLRSLARSGNEDLEGVIQDLDQCLTLDPNHHEAYARRALARQQAGSGENDEDEWLHQIERDLTCHLDLHPDQAPAWAHRAEVRLRRRDLPHALGDCEKALKLDADFPWAHGIKAVVHRLLSQWDESLEASDRAIELGLESADVYLSRAMAHQEQGRFEESYQDCSAAIELNPTQAGAYEFRGVLLLEQGDFEAAIADFTEAIQAGGDAARCFVNRGNAHRLNQNITSAIVDYGRAIEHEPKAVPAYLNRALALEQEGRIEDAIDDVTRALEFDHESVMALDIRGRLWQEIGESDRALEDWTQAISNQPDFAPALFNRGQLLMQLRRVDEAELDFSRLAELCPDWPIAHSSHGGALIQQGDMEAADAAFQEAIELDPDSAEAIRHQRLLFEAHYHQVHERFADAVRLATEALEMDDESRWALRLRAGAYWYNEEFVEAVDDYTRVLELDDESADDLASRGQALAELGEYEKALIDLEQALELTQGQVSPASRAYPLSGKGLALAGLGRFDEASQAIEQSIQLCPGNAWAYYNRGLLFREQGLTTQAVESFQEAIGLSHPALTPRKRQRAQAFIQQATSGSGGSADPDTTDER
jgi:tetratricopeptide (TPR) repeat protein